MILAWLSDPFTGEVNLGDTKGHFELPGSELMNCMYIYIYMYEYVTSKYGNISV